MGCPTGSAASILFCCICVVALSSSMAVDVGSAVPKKTPKFVNVGPAVPAKKPKFISMGALECSDNATKAAAARATTARKLIGVGVGVRVGVRGHAAVNADLQIPGVCPVRFDRTRGVSAVAGSCRERPVISPERCCGALKTYACPYSDLINNVDNGCANDMFYNLIVRGRLQPGLFSEMCVEGPLGLSC